MTKEPIIRNLTPLELSLEIRALRIAPRAEGEVNQISSLKPLETRQCGYSPVLVTWYWNHRQLGAFSKEGGFLPDDNLNITPILSKGLQPKVGVNQHVEFVNQTKFYVNIACEDSPPAIPPIPPGKAWRGATTWRGLWIATNAFTGEVLDVFISHLPPQQGGSLKHKITEDFRRLKAEKKGVILPPVLPAEVWWPVGKPSPSLEMVGYPSRLDAPELKDYIAVGVLMGTRRAHFNCIPNVMTRRIRISGVELRWDSSNEKLNGWAGGDHADIETLEMYADRVIIAQLLHFPQTNVTIWARELRFEGAGAIDTTPLGWTQRASWNPKLDPDEETKNPNKDADGGSDPLKNKNYVPKDGRSGEPAGNIVLNIRELIVPEGPEKRFRFIARGGKGQAAEHGFQPQVADLRSISSQEVEDVIGCFPIQNRCWQWRWPKSENFQETVDWPSQITFQGKRLLSDRNDSKVGHSNVVHLKLYAVSYAGFAEDANIFWFPGTDVWHEGWHHSFIPTRQELLNETRPAPQYVPGASAKPGGMPGEGGVGGDVTITAVHPRVASVCNLERGDPGDETPKVDGGQAGGPNPAYVVQMTIVLKVGENRRQIYDADHQMFPWLSVSPLAEGPSGKPAPAKTRKQDGGSGKVKAIEPGGAVQWMHTSALDAVLAYAKDCFRMNHRDLAASELAPYYVELRQLSAPPPNLNCRLPPIEAMRRNLLGNLDYYGHPPGWVPHLTATTTFTLNQLTRQVALDLLQFARAQIEAFDQKETAAADLAALREKLHKEVSHRQDALREAYQGILNAQTKLDKLQKDATSLDEMANKVKTALTQQIEDAIERQRIYSGVMKIVGGAMKIVPFGQPFLGLGADMVSSAGDIDWSDDNPGPQFSKMLSNVKGPVDNLVKETGKFVSDPDKPSKRALEDEITAAKRQEEDSKIAVEREEKKLERDYKKKKEDNEKLVGENDETIKTLLVDLKKANIRIGELKKKSEEKEVEDLSKTLGYGKAQAGLILAETNIVERDKKLIEELIERLKSEDARQKANADQATKNKYDQAIKLLEDKKSKTNDYSDALKSLNRSREDKATELARKSEETDVWVKRLEGVGTGLGRVGEGIGKLWVPPGADEAAAKAKIEQMMVPKPGEAKNPLRDSYRALMKDVEAIAGECKSALSQLNQKQQEAASEVASITSALTSLSELSVVSAELNGALDIRIRRHLEDMAARARETMQRSLYHFISACRYEYLEDVPPELYRVDAIVESFARLALFDKKGKPRKNADGTPMTISSMGDEFLKLDATFIKDQMFMIAEKIISKALSGQKRRSGQLYIELSKTQFGQFLTTLCKSRSLNINFAKELYLFPSLDCQGLRIQKISVPDNGIELTQSQGMPDSFNLVLTFSAPKQTIIYEKTSAFPDGAYFFFQKGDMDYAMQWKCTYHRSKSTSSITSHTAVEETLLGAILGKELKLRDYLPGLYGPPMTITAEIQGAPDFEFEITNLKFVIDYEATHEPPPAERQVLPARQ